LEELVHRQGAVRISTPTTWRCSAARPASGEWLPLSGELVAVCRDYGRGHLCL